MANLTDEDKTKNEEGGAGGDSSDGAHAGYFIRKQVAQFLGYALGPIVSIALVE